MNITFNTKVKTIPFSNKVKKFWDEKIIDLVKRKSTFSFGFNSTKYWSEQFEGKSGESVQVLYNSLRHVYPDEKQEINENCIEFLSLIAQEGCHLTDVINNSLELNKTLHEDDFSERFYIVASQFDLYFDYLIAKKEKLPQHIFEVIKNDIIDNQHHAYPDVNSNIKTLFKLISLSQEKFDHQTLYSLVKSSIIFKDDDTGEYIDHPNSLNYKSQRIIKNHVLENFPNQYDNFSVFFSNLNQDHIFSVKKLHKGELEINIPKMLDEYAIPDSVNIYTVQMIVEYCSKKMTEEKFLNMIKQSHIKIDHVEKEDKYNTTVVKYSSLNEDDIHDFANILQNTFQGMFPLFHKINISSTENYHGTGETIYTNINDEMLSKAYHSTMLEKNLNSNSTRKSTKKL